MKKHVLISILCFGLFLAAACVVYVPYSGREPGKWKEPRYSGEGYGDFRGDLDISFFYDYLSPYGMWINNPSYGYVWIPDSPYYGWRPYTYGRWVWTDYGWTWISNFKWGWAPFHYGRWGWDELIGWFWVPDTGWGPAWVSWRTSSLYIGWAPLPPGVLFVRGVGIRTLSVSLDSSFWIFVEGPHFLQNRLYRYVLPRERNLTIIHYTVHKNDIVFRDQKIVNEGISLDEAQRITKQRITKYELRDAARPGESRIRMGNVEVFKPAVRSNETAKPKVIRSESEARAQITKSRLRGSEETASSPREAEELDELHKNEVEVLKKSQENEINEIQNTYEVEKRRAKSPEEIEKIEKTYKAKIAQVKETHKVEKSKIEERHKKEAEKTQKRKIKEKKEHQ